MITKLLGSAAIAFGAAIAAAPLAVADPVSQYGSDDSVGGQTGERTVSPQELTAMMQAAQALSAMPPEQVGAMLQVAQSALNALSPPPSQ